MYEVKKLHIMRLNFISILIFLLIMAGGCGGNVNRSEPKTQNSEKISHEELNRETYFKASKIIPNSFLFIIIPSSLIFSVKDLGDYPCVISEGQKKIFQNCPIPNTPFSFYGSITQQGGISYLEMSTVYIDENTIFVKNATFHFNELTPVDLALFDSCFEFLPAGGNIFCLSNIILNMSFKDVDNLLFTFKFSEKSFIEVKDKIQNYVIMKFSNDFKSEILVKQNGLQLQISGKISLSGCISGDWEISGTIQSAIISCPISGSINLGAETLNFSEGKVIIENEQKDCSEILVCGNI